MIIDIITCKDQRKHVQIIDNKNILFINIKKISLLESMQFHIGFPYNDIQFKEKWHKSKNVYCSRQFFLSLIKHGAIKLLYNLNNKSKYFWKKKEDFNKNVSIGSSWFSGL